MNDETINIGDVVRHTIYNKYGIVCGYDEEKEYYKITYVYKIGGYYKNCVASKESYWHDSEIKLILSILSLNNNQI